jgi:hypothetical protein
MKRKRDIEMWMLLVIVLLTACSDHSGESSDENGDCFLDIYVYSPEHPMLTRADVGEIASRSVAENTVHTLQIWVFKHSDGSKAVGYLETTPTFLNETDGQEKFRMEVGKEFADHPENVDVYVVANAGSCGLVDGENKLTLGESTTRAELDAQMIGANYFGTSSLVSSVPNTETEKGLPMSGVLKDQSIYGSYPALRVGTQAAMATVQLTRAVSKLRFVLCRKTEDNDKTKKILESIDDIQLDGYKIPTESYLMPVSTPSYSSFVSTPINYSGVAKSDIPQVDNPMLYMYDKQEAQEYENLINAAVGSDLTWLQQYGTEKEISELTSLTSAALPQLKELGLTYLRESDQQLTGVITYKYKERNSLDTSWDAITPKQTTVQFSMATAGDFLRNHSWIIYIFFMDEKIHVLTVTNIGMKIWGNGGTETHDVYNW